MGGAAYIRLGVDVKKPRNRDIKTNAAASDAPAVKGL